MFPSSIEIAEWNEKDSPVKSATSNLLITKEGCVCVFSLEIFTQIGFQLLQDKWNICCNHFRDKISTDTVSGNNPCDWNSWIFHVLQWIRKMSVHVIGMNSGHCIKAGVTIYSGSCFGKIASYIMKGANSTF